ncbi:lactate/malate dehydrogenase, NAD binding domain [Popillia japonica]|uniref:L-lactate dehydrogenase n=1 Tax=Popillia japonica TaxID=7064 RepID=A0AAW1MNK5_POPJA
MKPLQLTESDGSNKVTVVGIGQVGMACAFSILSQKLTTNICLMDANADKLMGETCDLLHGVSFIGDCKIKGSTDYKDSANSKVCIITAGVRQREGETRLALVQRNVEVMRNIIPPLAKYSPKAIYIVVSNPVDVLTYVAWKLSGLPSEQVIGSGTNLDSSRFRHFLSNRLGIASTDCHGWIIGEHGDSSVAVWSNVNVCGVPLIQLNSKFGTPDDAEKWHLLHHDVIQSAYKVIKLKGYTSWATGLTISAVVRAILKTSFRALIKLSNLRDIRRGLLV